MKSVQRTAEKLERILMIIIQPSASRTTNPRTPIPSSKLLGYYHSSALRTDNSTFWAKPPSVCRKLLARIQQCAFTFSPSFRSDPDHLLLLVTDSGYHKVICPAISQ